MFRDGGNTKFDFCFAINYGVFVPANRLIRTEEQITDALNYGYKEALLKGITTGEYSFEFMGDIITVYLEEGVFKSGYGDYVYSFEEIMDLLGK